jgi:tetratricopeptide (TPR) repeat protein
MLANPIDFEFAERFDSRCHFVRQSPTPFLKSQQKAGCAQIWERTGRMQPESPRWAAFSLIIALLNFVLIVWPLPGHAQDYNHKPPTATQQFTVSVRELQIPAKARGAFLQGFNSLAKGDAAGSLQHFRRAIQEFPDFYEAYYNEGAAEIQLHQKEEALQSFQRAIDLSGGHYARAYIGYSLVLAQQGESKDAEVIVRRGLEEDPSLSDGYAILSMVLFDQNQLEEAEAAAHKALLLHNPSARNAHLTLGYVHLKRGEYRLAVQDLEAHLKAVRSTPCKDDTQRNQYIRKLLIEAKAKSAGQNHEGAP